MLDRLCGQLFMYCTLDTHINPNTQIRIIQLLIFTDKFSPLLGFEPGISPVPSRYATYWAILAWITLESWMVPIMIIKNELSGRYIRSGSFIFDNLILSIVGTFYRGVTKRTSTFFLAITDSAFVFEWEFQAYARPETSVVTDILIKIIVYQVSRCLNPSQSCQSIILYNGDQNTCAMSILYLMTSSINGTPKIWEHIFEGAHLCNGISAVVI